MSPLMGQAVHVRQMHVPRVPASVGINAPEQGLFFKRELGKGAWFAHLFTLHQGTLFCPNAQSLNKMRGSKCTSVAQCVW